MLTVPAGNLDGGERFAFGLRQHKPAIAIDKPCEEVGLIRLIGLCLALALYSDRHAEHERLLALLHMPAELLPAWERRDRSRRDLTLQALHPREQLITKRVTVKLGVRLRDNPGLL